MSEDIEAKPAGTVYSWIVVRHPFDPAFAEEVPYRVAMVDVDDDVRIPARIEGDAELSLGLAVKATFVDHESWTELRFLPVEVDRSNDVAKTEGA